MVGEILAVEYNYWFLPLPLLQRTSGGEKLGASVINNLLLTTATTKTGRKNSLEMWFLKIPIEATMNKSMIYALVLVVGLKKSGRKEKQRKEDSKIHNCKLHALQMKYLSLWNYMKDIISLGILSPGHGPTSLILRTEGSHFWRLDSRAILSRSYRSWLHGRIQCQVWNFPGAWHSKAVVDKHYRVNE